MDDIVVSDWYESLIDDCRAIMTEAVFNSRWALVEGYHQLGERIVNETRLVWNARGNGATLNDLSKSVGIHERRLYSAIQFYKKYPDINTLPHGKNISWNKIVTELLPDAPEPVYEICPTCGSRYKTPAPLRALAEE